MTELELQEKRKLVLSQLREAHKTGQVTVAGGSKISLWSAFRCLYCGEYFDQKGAEEHFGITRKQYLSESIE